MKTIADLVRDHPLFAEMGNEAVELLAGCGTNVRFAEDDVILAENASADVFYVIRKGKAALEVDTPRRGPLVIETLGPGEVLGVSWLLPPYRWTFDARAVEPVSAIRFDATCLRGKCDDDPVLGYQLFTRFAGLIRDRLQATRLQLLDLYGNDAS